MTTMTLIIVPIKIICKNTDTKENKCWKLVEKLEPLCIAGENIKWSRRCANGSVAPQNITHMAQEFSS